MQKHKLKRNIQKGLSIVSAGIVILTSCGCNKNESEASSSPTIVVTDELLKKEVHYEYVLNLALSNDENTKKKFENRPIMFMKVKDESLLTTEFKKAFGDINAELYNPGSLMNLKFFGVWPECYSHYTIEDFKFSNCKINLTQQTLENFQGNTCEYYSMKIVITENIPTSVYGENIKDLKVGDTIELSAVVAGDKTLAFNQTGAGSECENVQKAIYGEGTLKTITEAGVLLDKNELTMSKNEIYSLETLLNDEYLNNLKLKR